MQEADGSPRFVVIQPVEVATCGDARLAARARVEVHLEPVLLAGGRAAEGDQVAVIAIVIAHLAGVVSLREALHRREIGLFGEEQVDRRGLRDRYGHGTSTWTRPSATRTA